MARVSAGQEGREKATCAAHEGMWLPERFGIPGASGGEPCGDENGAETADGLH